MFPMPQASLWGRDACGRSRKPPRTCLPLLITWGERKLFAFLRALCPKDSFGAVEILILKILIQTEGSKLLHELASPLRFSALFAVEIVELASANSAV